MTTLQTDQTIHYPHEWDGDLNDLDYEDEDNWLKCPACGAKDPESLDYAHHDSDCPRNPYGINGPNLEEIISLLDNID
jgi:hypothetical protein